LSLTNEPEKLVNTALDTFSQVMGIECCWIQTIRGTQNQQLSLAAERGFSNDMRSEIVSMNMEHGFSRQIIGVGQKIIIPDLNNDGLYGLASFRTAGYKWLAAVPLLTYRVYGILGTASQNRKLLEKDTADLMLVVAGLIAGALSKAYLSQSAKPPGKPPEITIIAPEKTPTPPDINPEIIPDTSLLNAPPVNPPKPVDPGFQLHNQKMASFRQAHLHLKK
jgi:hypothetical protein